MADLWRPVVPLAVLLRHRRIFAEAKAFLDTSRLEGAKDALAAVVGILDQAWDMGDDLPS